MSKDMGNVGRVDFCRVPIIAGRDGTGWDVIGSPLFHKDFTPSQIPDGIQSKLSRPDLGTDRDSGTG